MRHSFWHPTSPSTIDHQLMGTEHYRDRASWAEDGAVWTAPFTRWEAQAQHADHISHTFFRAISISNALVVDRRSGQIPVPPKSPNAHRAVPVSNFCAKARQFIIFASSYPPIGEVACWMRLSLTCTLINCNTPPTSSMKNNNRQRSSFGQGAVVSTTNPTQSRRVKFMLDSRRP